MILNAIGRIHAPNSLWRISVEWTLTAADRLDRRNLQEYAANNLINQNNDAAMNIGELRIVFIGGIHGVGKTVFSERASQMLKIPRLNASTLITEQRNAPAAINKRVQSVEENQNALITAIESSPIHSKRFLLDGHFCVFDSSDLIKRVPSETFRTLAPIAVILLFDDVSRIQERLERRDKGKFSFELLSGLQKAELEHAEEVCSLLKIPMCTASASEHDKALQFAVGHFARLKNSYESIA